VALSDARWSPVELGVSRAAWGKGRGSEKRRDDCSRRAVGELYALDIVARVPEVYLKMAQFGCVVASNILGGLEAAIRRIV
jgi:transposase